jgi:uncharacterized protein (TIGR03083 family)
VRTGTGAPAARRADPLPTIGGVPDRLQAIRDDSSRIAELVVDADLDAGVPSCPDWSLRDLVQHLGRVQRFWSENVRAANPSEAWNGERVPPDSDDDLASWMRWSTEMLVTALRDTADDTPCWTWWGEPRTAGAIARHQVQETAVHRWDAESVGGTPRPLDAAVADDGVAEFLEVMLDPDVSGLSGAVAFIATDTGGTWQVGRDEPAAVVRATASDLVLLLYGRRPISAVAVDGDVAALQALLDAADVE